MLVLADTNVLLRVAEPKHRDHPRAVAAVRGLRQAVHVLCLVPQIHYELWVVATRPIETNGLGMTSDEVEAETQKLGPLLFRFLRDERAIYDVWHELVQKYGVQGKQAHDARLVAAMQRHGLTHILTFNTPDFQRYREIIVIDPATVAAL
jgi:predicted nucleic acid-binding protein